MTNFKYVIDKLPYINIPEFNGNFLLDTGSTRSFVSTNILNNPDYKDNIYTEHFNVKTAHGDSNHDKVAFIPLPKIFGVNKKHKFLIFDFDNKYKGLIGNDILEPLKCKIDLDKCQLNIKNNLIPIKYHNISISRIINNNLNISYDNIHINQELKENIKRIRMDHLNSEEKRELSKLCYQYRDTFYSEKLPLSFTHAVKHKLRLTDEIPIYTKNYRKPPMQNKIIQEQVDDLLAKGIIRESISPWSSPVHLVPKKSDLSGKIKWRMVIDYRKLNDKTIEDKYPIPNISDILDKLGRAQYFSCIDLASGYHQIEMDPHDIEKTAFNTDKHYEFLRMPFGLRNAPSTFQRLMNNILKDLIPNSCLVYLDDILVYSTSLQEHLVKLKQVFQRLREHNFKIQLDKSEFLKKEVNYLGHVLSDKGVQPNFDKIRVIKKFPIPKTQKEIKSFLGLLGYYRKFIPDFAKLTKPMTKCLKKNATVNHSKEFIESFEKSKEILSNSPVLQYPNFEQPFILTTDASDVSIGSVLSQGQVGSDRPVAYASRTLSETESRYSTIEKELLAIIWSVKYFRPYLYGRKFIIYTDHKPLTWLMSLKDPNSKLTRWRLRLEEYDYKIIYKKGKYNTNADALSRIKINTHEITQPGTSKETITNEDDDGLSNIDIRTLLDMPITPETEDTSTSNNQLDLIPISQDAIDKQLKQFHIRSSPGTKYRVEDKSKSNRIIKDVYIPVNNTETEIIKFLREHTVADRKFFCYFYNTELYPLFSKVYNSVFDQRGPKLFRCLTRITTVDDKNEQIEIIKKYHESKTIHRGIHETYNKIKKNYFWTNQLITIQKVINNCEICLKAKYDRNPIKPPLALTETPVKPMEHLFMDLYTIEGTTFLTIIDNFTKYAQAMHLTATTSIHIADALLQFLSILGIPNKITTDSDHKFENDIIKEICAMHKISIHFTTPYNPNSNSPIERFHSTIGELIRIQSLTDKNDVTHFMRYAVIAYNNSIHSATSFTPFELLFGHTKSRNPLEIYYTEEYYQDYVDKHKTTTEQIQKYVASKLQKDKNEKISKLNIDSDKISFKVGDKVYKQIAKTARSKKTEPRYIGPYTITKIHPNNILEIVGKHVNAKTIRVHCKMIRRPSQISGTSPLSDSQSSPQSDATSP